MTRRTIMHIPEGSEDYDSSDPRIDEVRVDEASDHAYLTHEPSSDAEQKFLDAREAGDTQGQLDALYEMVTGEAP